jgi:hypothetical protein
MPLIVETDLKEVLTDISKQLEKMGDRLGRLETGQARIEEKLDSLDKRVEKLLVSQIFRAGSKTKNRALLHKGFRKPKSGARINKDTNEKLEGSQNKQIWTLIGIVGTALVGTMIRFVITSLPAP